MQARLVVITATFTYDAKSSATPTPSALPGLAPGRQLVALLANKPCKLGHVISSSDTRRGVSKPERCIHVVGDLFDDILPTALHTESLRGPIAGVASSFPSFQMVFYEV